MGLTLGKLTNNIIASGYHPDQIDNVVISHIHPDHVGGLVLNGNKVFANATVHVPKLDEAYWLSAENREKAPDDAKQFFDQAVSSTKPYIDSNMLITYDADAPAILGVINSPHRPAPGHSAYYGLKAKAKNSFIGAILLMAMWFSSTSLA